MLEPMTPPKPGYLAICDRCKVALVVPADGVTEARATLQNAGWYEVTEEGRPRDRWAWCCPACGPTSPATPFGPTTL